MNDRIQLVGLIGMALAVAMFDRISKWFAVSFFSEPVMVNRFVTFDLAFNRGISGSLFHFNSAGGFFVVSTIVSCILIAITMWTWRIYQRGGPIIGQVLIITGGASNVLDRIIYGGVIDFISISLNGWNWALFNIADVAINIGILILILQSFRQKES